MLGNQLLAGYDRMTRLAAGYRMAGEDDLARAAHSAAIAFQQAYNALSTYHAALADAQNRETDR